LERDDEVNVLNTGKDLLADSTIQQSPDIGRQMAGSRDTTGLPNITDIVDKKRHALFGHVVRLDTSVLAHQALKQVITMKAGRCSDTNWRRLPDRPRKTWIQQIGDGTTTS